MFKKRKSKADALKERLQDTQDVAEVLRTTLGADIAQYYATKQQNKIQRLVNEAGEFVSEFKAAGTTYYIRNPKEGLPLRRQRELEKMSVVVPFNAGLGEVVASLQRMKQICNTLVGTSQSTPNLTGLIEEIINLERGLADSNRKWQASLIMCTLFIYRPGEDLRTWSMEDANSKIEDWAAEGLIEDDFFSLAMLWSTRKLTLQAKLLEQVKRGLRVLGFTDI
jgi:hypothetical protein